MSYHWFMDYLNLLELEELARAKLPRMAFDYYAGGSHDEVTLRENVAAFGRLRVHYRVLRDVSARSTKTRVLGHEVSFPVLVAPTAFHKMAHDDGELATARAARPRGVARWWSRWMRRSSGRASGACATSSRSRRVSPCRT